MSKTSSLPSSTLKINHLEKNIIVGWTTECNEYEIKYIIRLNIMDPRDDDLSTFILYAAQFCIQKYSGTFKTIANL